MARLDVDPIHASRRVVEHRRALGVGVALREPLEGVVQDVVGVGHLVHGEVALEHATAGAELLDPEKARWVVSEAAQSWLTAIGDLSLIMAVVPAVFDDAPPA